MKGVKGVAQQQLHMESRGHRAAGSRDNTLDEEQRPRGPRDPADPTDSHFSKPLSSPIGTHGWC